jgi:ABC-type nitrate/sulfonate/bicarbonate transport system substrate-binding protein
MRTIRAIGRVLLGLVVSTLISIAPMRAADTVTIGTVGSPSANLWPLFIGLDKGFFAAGNLRSMWSTSRPAQRSSSSSPRSLDDDVDRAVGPHPCHRSGAALAIARFEVQAPPYVMMAKAAIKSLKELKGKVISVGGAKDITRLYADRMLEPNGLKPGEYDFIYAGATTARAQALLSGAVGAAILLPPSNFQVSPPATTISGRR